MDEVDHRYECAKRHAQKIKEAADALDKAIHLAYSESGYHSIVRVVGVPIGQNRLAGVDKTPVRIDATILFEMGRAL